MCLNPKKIVNKGYNPEDIFSPYYINVPCGKCVECQEARVSEVLFRADYQNFDCVNHGGMCVFCTLTFNSQHLNQLTYIDKSEYIGKKRDFSHDILDSSLDFRYNVKTISTWNNRAFTKWRNALNMWLSRNNAQLKYLKSCERGSNDVYIDEHGFTRQATERPHYHVILWITPTNQDYSLTPDVVFRKLASLWSDSPRDNVAIDISTKVPFSRFVAKNKPIGYVYNELVVRGNNVAQATKYVVSYVFKNHAETLNHILDEFCLNSSLGISLKDSQPRYSCSNGIGLFFESLYDLDDMNSLVTRSCSLSDGEKCCIPRYYIKRFSQKVDIVGVDFVIDSKVIFNGKKRVFRCDGTLFDSLRVDFPKVPRLRTKVRTTPKGYEFKNASHYNNCVVSYQSLQNWLNEGYLVEDIDFSKLPFSSDLSLERLSFIRKLQNKVYSFRTSMYRYLSTLTFDSFCGMYNYSFHLNPNVWLAGQLPLSKNDEIVSFCSCLDYLTTFLELRKLQLSYNKSISRYQLFTQYKSTGLNNAINTNPYLFLPRLVAS